MDIEALTKKVAELEKTVEKTTSLKRASIMIKNSQIS